MSAAARERDRLARAVGEDPAIVGLAAAKLALGVCNRATRSSAAVAVLESNEEGADVDTLCTLGAYLCTGKSVPRSEAAGLAHLAAAAALRGRDVRRKQRRIDPGLGETAQMIAHAIEAIELGRAAWRAAGLDCSRFVRDVLGALQCDCLSMAHPPCNGCPCPHHRRWCERDAACDRPPQHGGDCNAKR